MLQAAAPGELSVRPIVCREAVGPDIPGPGLPNAAALGHGTLPDLTEDLGVCRSSEIALETALLGWPVQQDTASTVTKV